MSKDIMLFNHISGIEKVDEKKWNINRREAVRTVIIRNEHLLMVQNNMGDYKFPGGGVKNGEKHEEALKREVSEETGFVISDVKSLIGVFTERNYDEYETGSIFEMISYYYICSLTENKTFQQLDSYEAELNFKPVWVKIDEAIKKNVSIINMKDIGINKWVYRETFVLKQLKKAGGLGD